MLQSDEMIIMGIVGELGVGKTYFINRYLRESDPQKFKSTIAVQFSSGVHKCEEGSRMRIKFWDTSGQNKYKQMVCHHLKTADCIFIMYDITDSESFIKVKDWVKRLYQEKINPSILVLLGNKLDVCKENDSLRKVKKEAGQKLAKQIKAQFQELSSLNSNHVKNLTNRIVETVLSQRALKQINNNLAIIQDSQLTQSSFCDNCIIF